MATNGIVTVYHFLHFLVFIIFHNFKSGNAEFITLPIQTLESCNIDKIYQFGDSWSDAGNRIREWKPGASPVDCSTLPYGQNFYNHRPTGRCSNGKLIIDYIATAAGLPFLRPYKNFNAKFTHGVNFAVGGATALSARILAARNFTTLSTNSTLDVQLDWMSKYIHSICHNETDCLNKQVKDALFIIGEFGSDDYTYAYGSGKSFEEAKSLVPEVVQAIQNAARRVIDDYGSTIRLVIPGNIPIGCVPWYLTLFKSDDPFAYDENQCIKNPNLIAAYHNDHLQQAIEELKQEFINVTIIYGDYYNAFMWIFKNAQNLGFDENFTQKACCGGGGPYNFNPNKKCGSSSEATVCADPDVRIFWDDNHLTQAGYLNMAKWLLGTITPQLQCSTFVSR